MTEAWVLHEGPSDPGARGPGTLVREQFELPPVGDEQVLIETIYGCWEANMAHAIARQPIDVCRQRGEPRVVLGNSGVVRVLEAGRAVTTAMPGDVCLLYGIGAWDEWGYMTKALAYDAHGTMGTLARQSVVHQRNVIPLPAGPKYPLKRWAAFPLRYVTAWANWRVAFGCWKTQMSEASIPGSHVWGWGGGTTLGELLLAKQCGFTATMIASSDARLAQIEALGLETVDRRKFRDLDFDEVRFRADASYRARYLAAEEAFLATMRERTHGRGVSIFVDYIGTPVERATLRSLARQGVLATAGWKHGMASRTVRAVECIQRHIHVHTHGASYDEACRAAIEAAASGWLPPIEDDAAVYPWGDIPGLVADYAAARVQDYFPLYQVNAT